MAKTKEVREGTREGLRKNRTPRVLFAIEDAAPKPKSTSKKSTVPKTKANTSKPRAKAATAGRVEKKKSPATKNKRTPTVADKVKGVVEKVVGTIEGKPAKKVCCAPFTSPHLTGFNYHVHVNFVGRRWIAGGLTGTYRLPVRRRSRARMGRDLPGRRKLRPAWATAMANWFTVCANRKRELTIHVGDSGSLELRASFCPSISASGFLSSVQSEARRKM